MKLSGRSTERKQKNWSKRIWKVHKAWTTWCGISWILFSRGKKVWVCHQRGVLSSPSSKLASVLGIFKMSLVSFSITHAHTHNLEIVTCPRCISKVSPLEISPEMEEMDWTIGSIWTSPYVQAFCGMGSL